MLYKLNHFYIRCHTSKLIAVLIAFSFVLHLSCDSQHDIKADQSYISTTPMTVDNTPTATGYLFTKPHPAASAGGVSSIDFVSTAPDRDQYDLARRLWPDTPPEAYKSFLPTRTNHQVGDVGTFWVTDMINDSMYQIEAELLAISENALWYFQVGHEPPDKNLSLAVDSFEGKIFPSVVQTLLGAGKEKDAYVSPISILHLPLTGVAGYYNPRDIYSRHIYSFSNEMHLIYMNVRNFVGSSSYLGTLAHELQHAIHLSIDPTEETWVNEGMSEIAKSSAGYELSFVEYFVDNPDVSLSIWPIQSDNSAGNYGASSLFLQYLIDHYGSSETLRNLAAEPADGIHGIDAYLLDAGHKSTFQDVFQNWVVANYLHSLHIPPYFYKTMDVSVRPTSTITDYGVYVDSVSQYGAQYIDVKLNSGDAHIIFDGDHETPILPVAAHSGTHCWWGNTGDSIDSSLTAEFDLSEVPEASLHYWTWYSIEPWWDWAYALVSVNDGVSWDILNGRHTTSENPLGTSFGSGYTGESKSWVKESIDLTPYAGSPILLRFEYITDEASTGPGICIDDISIPEISFTDSAETDGLWEHSGFSRIGTNTSQPYSITIAEFGQSPTIRTIELDELANGSFLIEGFGSRIDTATIIIAPMAPTTSMPANYVLTVKPHTSPY